MATIPALACRTCEHDSTDHSALAGCTAKDGKAFCDCPAYAPPVATNQAHTGPAKAEAPSTGATIPSRTTDPVTSAKATPPPVKAGTQRAKMLAGFAALGPDGGMSETAAEAAGVPLSSEYAKRTSELAQAGLVRDTGETEAGASGQERIVWALTRDGWDTVDALGEPTPPRPERRRQITLTVAEMEALVRLTNRIGNPGNPIHGLGVNFTSDVTTVCDALTARDDKPARRGA